MNDLITVVVPVYNVEAYLQRCVDSIINQTYQNLEIILVDDGSPDNSGKICDEYAQKDSRVSVIHKENGGLSDARNAGIDIANGKYISFVDSDDWIPQGSIGLLYDILVQNDADIVSGDLMETYSDSGIQENKNDATITIYNTTEALENLMYLHQISISASGKIYKTSLFNDVRFPVGKLCEDIGTTYKIYAKSKKSVYVDQTVYYYFQNSNSITHTKYSSRLLDAIHFAEEICKFLFKNYNSIYSSGIFLLFFECLLALNEMPFHSKDKKYVYGIIKKYRKEVLNDKKLNKKQKILCATSFFGQAAIKSAFFIRGKLRRVRGGL